MNLAYSAEQVAGSLAQNICSVGGLSDMSNGKITHNKFWHKESKMACSIKPRFTAISKHSLVMGTPNNIREWLMSLPQDSPASLFQLPAKERQRTTLGTNGRRREVALASFDPDSASWKTSQVSFPNHTLEPFSGTWPRSGTIVDGKLYPRQKQELVTRGNGCGLWPTPTLCGNHNRKGVSATSGDGLATAVKQWPTPNCSNSTGAGSHGTGGDNLQTAVKFPTPTNSMMTVGDMEQARYAGNDGKRPSYQTANRAYSTPTTNDAKNATLPPSQSKRDGLVGEAIRDGLTGQLNADWVEWLMHWPVGWSSSEPITELKWLDPSTDPHPEIPRTTTGQKNRTNRLKGIGNGQYPDSAAWAWWILSGQDAVDVLGVCES